MHTKINQLPQLRSMPIPLPLRRWRVKRAALSTLVWNVVRSARKMHLTVKTITSISQNLKKQLHKVVCWMSDLALLMVMNLLECISPRIRSHDPIDIIPHLYFTYTCCSSYHSGRQIGPASSVAIFPFTSRPMSPLTNGTIMESI